MKFEVENSQKTSSMQIPLSEKNVTLTFVLPLFLARADNKLAT